jgi:hypothetical protein
LACPWQIPGADDGPGDRGGPGGLAGGLDRGRTPVQPGARAEPLQHRLEEALHHDDQHERHRERVDNRRGADDLHRPRLREAGAARAQRDARILQAPGRLQLGLRAHQSQHVQLLLFRHILAAPRRRLLRQCGEFPALPIPTLFFISLLGLTTIRLRYLVVRSSADLIPRRPRRRPKFAASWRISGNGSNNGSGNNGGSNSSNIKLIWNIDSFGFTPPRNVPYHEEEDRSLPCNEKSEHPSFLISRAFGPLWYRRDKWDPERDPLIKVSSSLMFG